MGLGRRSTSTSNYYNDAKGPDLYPSPGGIYPFNITDIKTHTYIDDGIYTVRLTVQDDDGLNSTYLSRIIVKNVAPKVNVSVFKTKIDKKQFANLSVRIAGEKWHDVKVELYKNGNEIANGSLVRYPGSPNKQMLHFLNQTLDSSSNWTAILYYTPDDDPVNGKPNGATPCWVILNLSNGKQIKLHHTFKVKHKKTHIWRVNLTRVLPSGGNSTRKGAFNITVFDPGADNISLYLDFGDGTNITKFYLNKNQTYPVRINLTLFHEYTSGGPFSVILIAKDDDGGITTVKVTLDFG
jgi:PKD repeat protein